MKRLWEIIFGMAFKTDLILAKLDTIEGLLLKLQAELVPPSAVSLSITTQGATKGANNMLQVKDTGSVLFTLVAKDAKDNPGATLDAAPTWKSSDETICTLNVAADGMTAVGVLTGKLGTFAAHVDASANGAALAADSDTVEVDPGAAALLQVSVAAQA